MRKKNKVLIFILVITLLFIFSPLFSKLAEIFFSAESSKQHLKRWIKLNEIYWGAEHRHKKYLEGLLPKR